MTSISSRQNPHFKFWLELLDGRGIKKAEQALISGRKLVNEFLRQNAPRAQALLLPPAAVPESPPKHVKTYELSAALFKELDVLGTKSPLLVASAPALPAWKFAAPKGVELIAALSDPGNLGALLRSCEAFGVSRVILSAEASSPFLPKVTRAASGANFRVALATTGPLAELKAAGAYALNMQGENLHGFAWPQNIHLILGEEGRGVPRHLDVKALSIPMLGHSESLNAMVAASIALFSYRRAHPGGIPVA